MVPSGAIMVPGICALDHYGTSTMLAGEPHQQHHGFFVSVMTAR